MNISTGKKPRAQKVVLYGPEGIGKTSLAAQFPDPLFIDTEGGTACYDVKRADPSPTSWAMLMGYVDEVARGGVGCSTLVIDTADWAERLCMAKVLADKGWKGIEDAPYGRGYKYVVEEFGRLLDRLSDVAEAGVNVVVTAHARVKRCDQPDEFGTYDRWQLKLQDTPNASNASMLKEWADMLLFLNYQTEVVKDENGKAKGTGGKRTMYTTHAPAWDAKNRHGLPEKLPLGYEGIAACIPDMRGAGTPSKRPAPEPPVKLKFTEVEPDAQEPAADSAAPVSGIDRGAYPEHMGPLLDLMEASGASEADVTSYVEAQGWYPKGTPLGNYEAGAVGWLVANWATVGKDIPTPIK
ncbi:MAG: ATP-binding protein [Eggerthellaceae bacterium]|nr:ATP-binding protein [Eggerthellaceae bacterium]